jgi:nitrate/nitrite transport system substrate-binding protein
MSMFKNPFDPNVKLGRCSCGKHHSQAEHEAAHAGSGVHDDETALHRAVESAVVRALFPADADRRNFIRAVGAGTALAAIGTLFPLDAVKAMAAEKGPLEKKNLKIGFVPITCSTPLIMAHPMGFYAKEGLDVQVIKTAGWALVRDKVINKEYDASHMLSPMPIAISMGLGSKPDPTYVATIQNINGQAITLHMKHKDKHNDPSKWKGMKFAVPFDYSMHNLLLRYYLAEHGVDPDKDVQISVVPPPEMVANLRAGNLDGYLGPEPFNQRAVFEGIGFIHVLSKDLWEGHPCCAFGVTGQFMKENPNTFAALFRSIASATAYAHKPENRKEIVKAIAPAGYLNQPEIVLEQVMTGRYADGLGNIVNAPERADFDPFPWNSMAVWILTQMKRWGYIKGDVNYKQIAEQIFLATDARTRLTEMGLPAPKSNYAKHTIMGKQFDPARPEAYLKSFKIRRT